MLRLLNIITLMLALLISAAHAEGNRNRDFDDNRNRDSDRNRNRDFDDNRNRDSDRNRNREDVFALIPLGNKVVDFGRDYDVVDVNYPQEFFNGRLFRALQFYISRNDIYLDRIRVVYFEGFPEDFSVNLPIARGQQIQVDLNGDKSYIRRIEMWYRSRAGNPGQAHVHVWGEPTRTAGRPPRGREVPVEIACRDVDLYGTDRDTIRVPPGRRFSALQLFVNNESIRMLDLQVVDGDGRTSDIRVRRRIAAGGTSGRLDLVGGEREIVQILMTYESQTRDSIGGGRPFLLPKVCVQGFELIRDVLR